MNVFIIQTIVLSLAAFLIGLWLGRFLKKLFCNHDAQNVEGSDATGSASTGKHQTVESTNKSSVAAKAVGVSAAVTGAAAIAKTMSEGEGGKEAGASLEEDIIPSTDQLVEKVDGIQATVGDKAGNLIDTAKESVIKTAEDMTSSADGSIDLNMEKAAITSATSAVAATAGASLLNKESQDTTDPSNEKATSSSMRKKTSTSSVGHSSGHSTPQASEQSASFTAVDTIHRTIRRRHRSRSGRK